MTREQEENRTRASRLDLGGDFSFGCNTQDAWCIYQLLPTQPRYRADQDCKTELVSQETSGELESPGPGDRLVLTYN